MTIADPPALDAARPWPGLDAFSEERREYFFGRDEDAEDLFRRLRRDPVTLLYGQSGLGKTSLLQAGLFPRLRAAGFLPILIRLDYAEGASSPSAQVKATMENEFAAELAEATTIGTEDTLWAYFHRLSRHLVGRDGKEVVPVLIFDQFEEIFTLGLAREGSRAASQSFLVELADLIENRPPEAFEQAIEADPDIIERYEFHRQDYRVVIALREDFLAPLESLRARAPTLGRNRYRLRPMSGDQAGDAILRPAPGLIAPGLAGEIIRFVGRADPENAFGGEADSGPRFEVEPALLSLVCSELNESRLAAELDTITPDLLAENRDKIIESFYERSLADQPPPVRIFIEDELLSDSGVRESISLDGARSALAAAGVEPGALEKLVGRRFLRIEERLDVARVEIIHDVLAPVIRHSRDTRRLRQAEAEAKARDVALRRARRRTRFAYVLVGLMAVLMAATGGLAWWGYRQQQQAERNFDAAVATADFLVTTVAQRLKPLAGVSAQTVRNILGDAERAFNRLAAIAPDSPYLRWRRAEMEVSFVAVYLALGDGAEALRQAEDARDTMAALAAQEPGNDQYQDSLAETHVAVGDTLCGVVGSCGANLAAALVEYHADLDIMQRLAAKDASNAGWQRDLAVAHERIGDVLRARGDLAGALAEYRAEFAIIGPLVKIYPDDEGLQRFSSVVHEKIGNILRAQGDLAGALTEFRAEFAIAQPLAEKYPGNSDWQRFISVVHEKIGDVLSDQGDLAGALAEYRAALGIRQQLAAQDPGNAGWQRDLSVSHEKVGDVLRDQGDLAGALIEYRADLAITQRLATRAPNNAGWQRDLSISHEKVGDVLSDQGDLAGALAEYRAELDIAQRLATKDPANSEWQRGLSVTHEKVGDVLRDQGDLAGALTEFRADLDIAVRLVAQNPANTGWQRDLSISREKIGDVLRAQGNLAGALVEFRADLDISLRLTAQDPGNAIWQRGLMLCYERLGLVASDQNDLPGALDAFEKAEKIALHLKEINPTAAASAKDLTWVEDHLAAARKKAAGTGDAK